MVNPDDNHLFETDGSGLSEGGESLDRSDRRIADGKPYIFVGDVGGVEIAVRLLGEESRLHKKNCDDKDKTNFKRFIHLPSRTH